MLLDAEVVVQSGSMPLNILNAIREQTRIMNRNPDHVHRHNRMVRAVFRGVFQVLDSRDGDRVLRCIDR
jgi:hypothetical protein